MFWALYTCCKCSEHVYVVNILFCLHCKTFGMEWYEAVKQQNTGSKFQKFERIEWFTVDYVIATIHLDSNEDNTTDMSRTSQIGQFQSIQVC